MTETKILAIPKPLAVTDLQFYVYSISFVVGNVLLPLAVHQFGGMTAGQALLPLYFFSLLGGLAYGWQLGLTVGVLSPLVSFALSGMPPVVILPFVILKSAILGVTGGIISRRVRSFVIASLLAVLAAQLIGITVIWLTTGKSVMALSDIRVGYLGLLLQSFIAPKIVNFLPRHGDQEVPRNC